MTRPKTYKKHKIKNAPGAGRPVLADCGSRRVMFYVSHDMFDDMEEKRKKRGATMSDFGRLLIRYGLEQIK